MASDLSRRDVLLAAGATAVIGALPVPALADRRHALVMVAGKIDEALADQVRNGLARLRLCSMWADYPELEVAAVRGYAPEVTLWRRAGGWDVESGVFEENGKLTGRSLVSVADAHGLGPVMKWVDLMLRVEYGA